MDVGLPTILNRIKTMESQENSQEYVVISSDEDSLACNEIVQYSTQSAPLTLDGSKLAGKTVIVYPSVIPKFIPIVPEEQSA